MSLRYWKRIGKTYAVLVGLGTFFAATAFVPALDLAPFEAFFAGTSDFELASLVLFDNFLRFVSFS